MSFTLSEIVAQLGGELRGQDARIERLAPLESAMADEITFITSAKFRPLLKTSKAGAMIVSPKLVDDVDPRMPAIVIADPYLYFAKVATLFHPAPQAVAGVHDVIIAAAIGNHHAPSLMHDFGLFRHNLCAAFNQYVQL